MDANPRERRTGYEVNLTLTIPEREALKKRARAVIQSDHVTLDLNGFSVRCSSCSGTGTGDGIFADIAVRNGSVVGVGNRGIALMGMIAHVDGVRVTGAGGIGIRLGDRSLLSRSQSTHSSRGVQIGRGSAVIDTVASLNFGGGISLNEFALIAGVTANENQLNGIVPTDGSVVIGSTANMNGGKGVLSQETAIVQSSAQANQGDGIECFDCLVLRSNVVDNAGVGIEGTRTGYGDNLLRFNGGGEVSGALEISGNVCGFGLSCP